jgi:hypothetical protein
MELGLAAPLAVAVEVVGDDRRIFRLSSSVSAEGLELDRPASFDPDRLVTCRFILPDHADVISLPARVKPRDEIDAAVGGSRLVFVAPPAEVRVALAGYVRDRLGLPPPPGESAP